MFTNTTKIMMATETIAADPVIKKCTTLVKI